MNTKQELKKMTKEVISPCKNAHDILTVTTQDEIALLCERSVFRILDTS